MGVCCVVFFYIDGMLFEFRMHFLNIEKNKILRIISSIFHVFFAFYAISNIYNFLFFLEKHLSHFISRFMLFSPFGGGGNIEKCPFTYWLNREVVSPNSR